jgi:cytochrome c oxidase subunit I
MFSHGVPQGITSPPLHSLSAEERERIAHDERSWMGPAPGTFVLVFVFLLAFMVYFFVNWKMLSFVWKIG